MIVTSHMGGIVIAAAASPTVAATSSRHHPMETQRSATIGVVGVGATGTGGWTTAGDMNIGSHGRRQRVSRTVRGRSGRGRRRQRWWRRRRRGKAVVVHRGGLGHGIVGIVHRSGIKRRRRAGRRIVGTVIVPIHTRILARRRSRSGGVSGLTGGRPVG